MRAQPVPSFAPGGAPVSVLVDYDGTISTRDVGDELMARFYDDATVLAEKDDAYYERRIGSRELMLWDLSVLPPDEALLRDAALEVALDEAFPSFVAMCARHGAAIEVVSDGFGFHVEAALARVGAGDLPVATNETTFRNGTSEMTFPYGHPACFVCGTCKRERVRVHQAAKRAVVFIGDGTSDRFAAAHADLVYAKGQLAALCGREGWPFQAWRSFIDVTDSVSDAFSSGDLPLTRNDFERWRAERAPAPRGFICGPEVWGPGRTIPGPGPR